MRSAKRALSRAGAWPLANSGAQDAAGSARATAGGTPHQLSSGLFRMRYLVRGVVGGLACEHDASDAEQAIGYGA